jgi:hypothetical protein
MKFAPDRPFTDPDAAARKLLDIVRGSIAASTLSTARRMYRRIWLFP